MDGTHSALVLITSALFIAMVIERILEIVMATYTLFEIKCGWFNFWNCRAIHLQKRLHDFNINNLSATEKSKKTSFQLAQIRERVIGTLLARLKIDDPAYTDVASLSVAKLRHFCIKFSLKVLGSLLGIIIAVLVNIDMFALISQLLKQPPSSAPSQWLILLHQILTGIAMGLGAGPLHKIITALEKAKQKRKTH